MKRFISILLVLAMLVSFSSCGAGQKACNHEYEAKVEGKTVTLTCRLCGQTASAEVELPKETVEVEKIVEKPVEVEKIIEKPVAKTVIKEVEKLVEVPVYMTDEDRLDAEEKELLSYYTENYGKLDFLKSYIAENYYKEVDEDALMEGAYTGLVDALGDPYSHYASPSESEEYGNALTQAYSGIGITIMADDNENAVVSDVGYGSPAEECGIQPGDIIAAADGVSLLGKGIEAAASAIRGEVGTDVEIEIIRGSEHITMNVTRRQISQSTVDYGFFIDGTGYISISGFNELTPYEMSIVLANFEFMGIQNFILDLRNNGGGMVNAAWMVADMLMDEGVMTYIQDRAGNRDYYNTYEGRTPLNYIVLCNENSASATEMLCAGIQDNNEGILVGTRTYGKGVVQVYTPLEDGSSLNLTMYQYFSPNGKEIHGNGITPDYIVELTEDCFDEAGNLIEDAQLIKAFEILYEE